MMAWLHNWIWIQQDYLWFLAGIGWLSVGAVWWHQRRTGEMPGWIPWSVGAGIAIAVTQILILVTPVVHLAPNDPISLRGDLCLGFALAIQAAGWWVSGLRRTRGGPVVAAVIAVLMLLAAGWRYESPTEGTLVLLVGFAGALAWWSFVETNDARSWRGAIVAIALAALVDTTGPLALAILAPQRWFDSSPLGPWWAIAQCVAAGVVLGHWYQRHPVTGGSDEDRRVQRWFVGGVVAWMALGFAFAVAVGTWGRREFEKSALGRVRAAAALLPKENVEQLLDDRLRLEPVQTMDIGSRNVAQSTHASTFARSVTLDLNRLATAHDDVRWISIMTLRDGWLVGTAFANRPLVNLGILTLYRRDDPVDAVEWGAKNATVSGPVTLGPSERILARAPLLAEDGRMLGWLTFSFGVSQWIAAQAQPRALAYLIVALGLIVGRQLLVQRSRVRERDRAQADAESAEQASRLKTTFLANVSHELRTPLQSIQGYTELILPNLGARDRERLLAVREHADLMGRLVNDLIDLSAAESGQFHLIERPVVLTDLVVQATESLRHRAEAKDLALAVDASPEVPGWIFADPQRVRQIVLNLVGNAIKYTDYGSVSVVLALAGRDREAVEMELRVTDTGPGVPPEKQPFLFEAFHRLEGTQEREGTGLGLAIVAAVSRAMGGSVRVRSDGRSGSTFIARWRLRLAPNAGPAPSSRIPLHGKKVLVADDNALVRDLFVAYLTECGAVCATAADGHDAVRRLRSEDYDAVVLDLAMPRLDGIAAVRQIRREMPDKQWRIVGVSAHAGGAERDEALAAGMDDFLIKPVSLPELARALAPSIVWAPPSRSFEPIRAHFAHRFRTDAPAQSAAVARALDSGRWPEIHAAAHYLKNSADVVGDEELARACAALEAAARARDSKAGQEAWRSCRLALARWLSEPAAN